MTDTEDGGKLTSGISYRPILPKGVEVKKTELLTTSDQTGRWLFEVTQDKFHTFSIYVRLKILTAIGGDD
ncbi:hypothetical protein [Granulicella arctica]|uniref:hypothetical protein n=1 Tax=Granulicella arctica TaxID=940613 RepID=UPI0021DFAC7F|nr:hypothetical protein [Granulicella arctica]